MSQDLTALAAAPPVPPAASPSASPAPGDGTTPPDGSGDDDGNGGDGNDGVGAGLIAGVVVGALVCVAALVAGVWYFRNQGTSGGSAPGSAGGAAAGGSGAAAYQVKPEQGGQTKGRSVAPADSKEASTGAAGFGGSNPMQAQ